MLDWKMKLSLAKVPRAKTRWPLQANDLLHSAYLWSVSVYTLWELRDKRTSVCSFHTYHRSQHPLHMAELPSLLAVKSGFFKTVEYANVNSSMTFPFCTTFGWKKTIIFIWNTRGSYITLKHKKIHSQKHSASQNSNFVKYLGFNKILELCPS